ncbi:MAG: 2-dehydro-3-deoxyphosphogluconate aldolase, partial [Spirochaetales bacterium]
MNENLVKKFRETGIVPVIKLESPDKALPLAEALLRAELPIAEITFRTEAAEASIRSVARTLPQMLVGAGTVLTVEQARRALDAGARFAVTPGFNARVVEFCLDKGLPVFPGVNSPTNVEQAMEYGLTVLKFFPAEVSGGTAMLKALQGPYGGMSFIPTGGVNPDNAA